ncbi:phosphatidylethanolamine-binding protein [Xylogone sp. PMI_703]|nr:phosphatidylethanolamine-binding protein [Xylogone sp. PMI_703]
MWLSTSKFLQLFCRLMILGYSVAQTPPDYIPSTRNSLSLTFGSKAVSQPGEQLGTSDVQAAPTVDSNTTLSGTYLLLMINPDAPLPPENSLPEFVHWIQPDITQSSSNGVLILSQPAFRDWQPPAPPSGGAPSRFIVMLFEQSSKTFTVPSDFEHYSSGSPSGFNTTNFAAEGNLSLVAANYFLVAATDTTTSSTSSSAPGSVLTSATPSPSSSALTVPSKASEKLISSKKHLCLLLAAHFLFYLYS